MAATKKANMIVPEVFGDMVQAEFKGKLVIGDFAITDNTLEGQAGDTIHFPKYKALGDATDLVEGVGMDTEILSTEDSTAVVKEAGKAVEISDSAQISALGNPIQEATRQLGIIIARKVDADLVSEAITSCPEGRKVKEGASFGVKVAKAKALWGDAPEEISALLVNSEKYTELLTDPMFTDNTKYNADVMIKGEVGRILGVPVVLTDRIPSKKSLMLEKGALAYLTKRQPLTETDRDILARTTVVATNVHYAVKLVKEDGIAVIDETV